ncbi:MAG: tryptophan 7-halogenase [Polyangiaceae bacterium]
MAQWDVIVVGAGPAGAALACALAPQKRRVLLLERAAAPNAAAPRIGESLPGAARPLLARLGVLERFLADGHVERGATVAEWERDEASWFDTLRDPHGPGWHLDRVRFDACLRRAACDVGAVLLQSRGPLRVERASNQRFIVTSGGAEPHYAPVLVDASGRGAVAARRLGVLHHALDKLVCLHSHLTTTIDGGDDCTRIATDHNGWWYSVRVPSGQRVLAFHLDADDAELGALRDPGAFLAKARRQPLLAETLRNAQVAAVRTCVACSSTLDLSALLAVEGFFAVGDSSLSFDPLASQGLFHALASAVSAATAMGRSDGEGAPRQAFVAELRAVRSRYRAELRRSYASVARRRSGAFWARRL